MPGLHGLTAALMVGGLGTRLSSVVSDRPKVLAEVRNQPFLAYLLAQLAQTEIQTVVLCTGYMSEAIRQRFGSCYRSLSLLYSQEPEPLGTAGALRLALPLLTSDNVLAMNGDSYCQVDLDRFGAFHAARRAVSMVVNQVPDTARYGRVELTADDQVASFREKDGQHVPGWINAGIYMMPRHVLEEIPADRPVSLEREILPAWARRGLFGFKTTGRFLDIGTPESYREADAFFAGMET